MDAVNAICAQIAPARRDLAHKTRRRLDAKTKPRGSLGRLEDLCCQICASRQLPEADPPAPLRKAIVVMAADHGIAARGVSAYPQEVTWQMLLNFARGGAAINVLARHAGARLVVVDMGVNRTVDDTPSQILDRRIGSGTQDFSVGPAMTREQANQGLQIGIDLARELSDDGIDLIGIGEMGIGNTTASSALTAVLTRTSPQEVTGTGTGIDHQTRFRKEALIRKAIELNDPNPVDTVDTLTKLGGFEIAGLAGIVLGAAACRIPVVIDGFIASTAALVAAGIAPLVTDYVIASHQSVEPGHQAVLRALKTRPLLNLGLRLGEGTGAALAMHLVDASMLLLQEMATFDEAGVTDI